MGNNVYSYVSENPKNLRYVVATLFRENAYASGNEQLINRSCTIRIASYLQLKIDIPITSFCAEK